MEQKYKEALGKINKLQSTKPTILNENMMECNKIPGFTAYFYLGLICGYWHAVEIAREVLENK